MRKVSKDEFYRSIGPLNVHPSIQHGNYPYTAIWKTQTGAQQVVGKTIGRTEGGRTVTDYYLGAERNA